MGEARFVVDTASGSVAPLGEVGDDKLGTANLGDDFVLNLVNVLSLIDP